MNKNNGYNGERILKATSENKSIAVNDTYIQRDLHTKIKKKEEEK